MNDYIQNYVEERTKKINKTTSHKKIYKMFKSGFLNTEKKLAKSGIDFSNSGTCAICVLIKQ